MISANWDQQLIPHVCGLNRFIPVFSPLGLHSIFSSLAPYVYSSINVNVLAHLTCFIAPFKMGTLEEDWHMIMEAACTLEPSSRNVVFFTSAFSARSIGAKHILPIDGIQQKSVWVMD